MRDPAGQDGNGQPPPQQTQPNNDKGLTSDQQKVAAALDKVAAAQPEPAVKSTQPKIHKTIFTAPPNAVLEKDFKLGEDDATIVDEKVEPVIKVEDTNKDNTKGKEGQQQTQQQPPPAKSTDVKVDVKVQPKPFDYTGFQPEEIAHLKQMSNSAREFTAKAIRDLSALRNQAPDLYFQHQEAYTLDPHYKELNTTIDFMGRESEHWKQQLLAIRQGKPWMMLEGYDDKGQPILKGPFKPTDESDIMVGNALQIVSGQLGQMQQQKAGYGQQYQQRIKQDNAVLDAERANRFEWVKDPAKLEEKVDIGGKVGEVSIKQIRDDFKGLFASYHRGNPVLEMAADMFVALQIYGSRIRELEGSNQHQKRVAQDVLSGEPNMETQAANGKSEKMDFSVEGLPG